MTRFENAGSSTNASTNAWLSTQRSVRSYTHAIGVETKRNDFIHLYPPFLALRAPKSCFVMRPPRRRGCHRICRLLIRSRSEPGARHEVALIILEVWHSRALAEQYKEA